jgi:hypothetical protein
MKAMKNGALVLLALTACRRDPPPPNVCPTATTSTSGSERSAGPPPESLVGRVREIAGRVERDGVALQGIGSHGFITHQSAVTTAFEVPAGRCLSIVTVGTEGLRDLDAHLFEPGGDLLVEDVETDPHPTVQLCAREARRVYHVLEAYEGQGAYLVASFVSERAGLERVARVVGGHPGVAAGTGGERSDLERRMNEFRDGVARRGFQPSGDPARADFTGTGAMRFPLPVTPDRCYTLAAVAEGEVSNADLSVYDLDGDEIVRDVRPDRDAYAQFCPPAAATLSVEVRAGANSGAGAVVLQAFAADAAALGGANTLWLGERLSWGASAVALADATPVVVRRLGSLGYAPAAGTPLGRGQTQTFAAGESREFRVATSPGRCMAVAAVGGRGLGRMRVDLYDPSGELVARGARHEAGVVAVACTSNREELRAQVAAEVGSGDATVQVFQNGALPPWASEVDRVAVAGALADAWAMSDTGWQAQGTPEKLRLGAGAVRAREFERPAGRCVRWSVATGGGAPWVALVLRGADGASLATASGEGHTSITRCGGGAERLQVEVRTDPANAPEVDAMLTRRERPDAPAR